MEWEIRASYLLTTWQHFGKWDGRGQFIRITLDTYNSAHFIFDNVTLYTFLSLN